MIDEKLTKRAEQKLNMPCEVFRAVREHGGELVKGYWLQVFEDERRERWIRFEFLGKVRSQAQRKVNRLSRLFTPPPPAGRGGKEE